MTNNCLVIIPGLTSLKPHPHHWQYLVKDKRQCYHCNLSQEYQGAGAGWLDAAESEQQPTKELGGYFYSQSPIKKEVFD